MSGVTRGSLMRESIVRLIYWLNLNAYSFTMIFVTARFKFNLAIKALSSGSANYSSPSLIDTIGIKGRTIPVSSNTM